MLYYSLNNSLQSLAPALMLTLIIIVGVLFCIICIITLVDYFEALA